MNTLLIEDDEIDVEAVTRAFTKAGLDTPNHIGRDGAEALRYLQEPANRNRLGDGCLIILDLNMVGMNGFDFLDHLRSDDLIKQSVVIVFSTSNDENDLLGAYQRCVSAYVRKSDAGSGYERLTDLIRSYEAAVEFPPLGPVRET